MNNEREHFRPKSVAPEPICENPLSLEYLACVIEGLQGMSSDPTRRFGNRADDYAKARPSYPPEIFDFLADEFGMTTGQTAADLGSGTGISSAQLLDRGLRVFAVEPNAPMRAAAEKTLGARPGFVSVNGCAETT